MKLFVYGTLQSGYGNNRLLHGATLLGKALTVQKYVLFNCGFPMAVPHTKGNIPLLPVMGEVWKVTDAHVSRCDSLEGHPNWYIRRVIETTPVDFLDDQEQMTHIYEMPEWQDRRLCNVINNEYYKWA